MALDPQARAVIDLAIKSGRPAYNTLAPKEARQLFRETRPAATPTPREIGAVRDLTVDGPGGPIPLRVYRPAGVAAGTALPVLVYYHGGGWVIGDLDTHDVQCRQLTAEAGITVVAVDYRLAPEHKFPAAVDDAVASFHWLAEQGVELGIDPARIVIAGDSAGGTLAAVVSQLVRGQPRSPCLQWLIYPATDLAADLPSHRSCAKDFLLTQDDMQWFSTLYLNDPSEIADPRISPLRAADLSGLPPALIFTAGFDPLRDEGQAYADRLTAAGVKTIHREFDSLIHGFVGMRGALQAAARAMDDMVAGLRHELAGLGR
jgi:acetyl esterase